MKAHQGGKKKAVDECIGEGILREILLTRRAEVMNSILTEYDEEQVLADIGQERYEEGWLKLAARSDSIESFKALMYKN